MSASLVAPHAASASPLNPPVKQHNGSGGGSTGTKRVKPEEAYFGGASADLLFVCPLQGEGPAPQGPAPEHPCPQQHHPFGRWAEKINEGGKRRWGAQRGPFKLPPDKPCAQRPFPELRVKVVFPVDLLPFFLPFPSRALCPL